MTIVPRISTFGADLGRCIDVWKFADGQDYYVEDNVDEVYVCREDGAYMIGEQVVRK